MDKTQYEIDFRDLLSDVTDALSDADDHLQDLDNCMARTYGLSKGTPYSTQWLQSDFDCHWGEVAKVLQKAQEELDRFVDPLVPCTRFGWALILPGGAWALAYVTVPTESIASIRLDDAAIGLLCEPLLAKLVDRHAELQTTITHTLISRQDDTAEAEHAA